MFKNLISFWKAKDFLTEVLGDFSKMLDDSRGMFEVVCQRLIEHKEIPGIKDRIYAIDRNVNELEKDIRKRIIKHLSIQPGVDVPASLLLMSVVKDAERLGDYAKNLFEVADFLKEPVDKETFRKYLNNLDKKILAMFDKTKQAFIESDEKLAKELLDMERVIVKQCDAVLKELANSDLSTNVAVCLALIARYFKRIAAHLTNIGSSVVLPISDLDFFDEKLSRDAE